MKARDGETQQSLGGESKGGFEGWGDEGMEERQSGRRD